MNGRACFNSPTPVFLGGSALIESIVELVHAHRTGLQTPIATVKRSFARIRACGDAALFINLRDETQVVAEARALMTSNPDKPLYGIPVAIKDNIDVQGLPTTAACPDFAYRPTDDAEVVARLRRAGAIVIGKTNLDQFATGLVGTRSPYGVPRNAIKPELIPGGSSSGSAVAVAAGIVPLSLGTDTAGSGRVPAALNNIVGLKPSIGLLPCTGVVPACRSLDCVSIFALTTDDCWTALMAMAGPDAADPYSRHRPPARLGTFPQGLRLGVPRKKERIFFGDRVAADSYQQALARAAALSAHIIEIDMEPFYETAQLLYGGPWVAERYIVLRSLLTSSPSSVHPVTREIVAKGAQLTAAETFAAFYKLEALRRASDLAFRNIDALLLPTVPTAYTLRSVAADPIELNNRLGTYTNFVNLLDLCALALPSSMRPDGIPFGITLIANAGDDAILASIGRVLHADSGLSMGAIGVPLPPLAPLSNTPEGGEIPLAVVGAHLSGMPLNGELRSLGGRLLETTSLAPDYRLYVLADSNPPKPGLLRVAAGTGSAIAIEVWALPGEGFARFVDAVPPPLSIGTLRLVDGRMVKGFLVEACAVADAPDISSFGGWRNYLACVAGG
jgi:allophanate hydrolase